MNRWLLLACCLAALLIPRPGRASRPDTILVLEPIDVAAERIRFGTSTVTLGREDLNRALEALGLMMVRRGIPLSSDLSFEGFKRADIGVVVDGERYHCACPNRMDPPTSLAIPIEIATVTREASSAEPGASLAGRVSLERARPADGWGVNGGLSSMLGSEQDVNGSVALEGRRHRLAARWAQGRSYADARGRDFGTLYGFRAGDVDYAQGDVALRGETGAFAWGAQHSTTRDVPFASLLMDERDNRLTSVSVAAWGHKLYANRASHLMDNGLRTSTATMRMSTDADQTTVGASGRAGPLAYEAFFRRWDADNVISTATARVDNPMLPDVRQWAANLSASRELGPVTASLRAGWTRVAVGDRPALAHHRILTPGASDERTFVPFAVSAGASAPERAGLRPGVSLEAVSEQPGIEQLYITVRRPGMPAMRKPDWVGNPTLDAARRLTARVTLRHALGTLEGHVSRLSDHVLPVAASSGLLRLQTFRGVEALVAALSLRAAAGPAELQGAWTSGQDLSADGPLAEIAPLAGSLTLRAPGLAGLRAFARGSGATRARRVDAALGETPTAAWARLDLGARWDGIPGASVEAEIENVTDVLYTQHLSYLRDPFSAGLRVWEPGRVFRLMVSFDR